MKVWVILEKIEEEDPSSWGPYGHKVLKGVKLCSITTDEAVVKNIRDNPSNLYADGPHEIEGAVSKEDMDKWKVEHSGLSWQINKDRQGGV